MPRRPKSFRYHKRNRTQEHRAYLLRKGVSEARRFRSSRAWANARELARSRFPVCCDPFGAHAQDGVVEPTAHIHHIEPLERRPDLGCTPSNLAPLCVACHARVEAMERKGEATAYLFAEFQRQLKETFGDG